MIKQVIAATDFSFFAGLSSVIFFSVFCTAFAYVLLSKRESFKHHKEMPFND